MVTKAVTSYPMEGMGYDDLK